MTAIPNYATGTITFIGRRRPLVRRGPLPETTKAKIRAKALARWAENAEYRARITAVLLERHQSQEWKEKHSEGMRRIWKTKAYRDRQLPRLLAAQALAAEAVKKYHAARPRIQPPAATPEGRLYRKLRRALGPKAARQELGIGR